MPVKDRDISSECQEENGRLKAEMLALQEEKNRLQETCRFYESILDAIPFPLSVTDTAMKWTFVNKAVEDMKGIRREDVIGHPCSEWKADICGTEKCGVEELRKGRKGTEFEEGGHSFKVDAVYLKDPSGEIQGHLEVVQDITGLKLMERRFSRMIAQNPLAIAILRADKSRIDINEEYVRMWRGTREETLRKKLYDYNITILNDVDFYTCYTTKKHARSEVKVSWPDGVEKYLVLDAIPILDEKGEIDVAFYVWSDLTDMRKREEDAKRLSRRVDLMIRDNPLAIAILRADKSRIDINEEYVRMWRGTKEETLRKKLYDYNITVLNGVDFYTCYTTKKHARTEVRVSWPDGVEKYLVLDAIPILDEKGEIDVAFYVWSEITDLKKREEDARRLSTRVEKMIQDNPLAIAMLARDKSRLDLNKGYEELWRGTREELMKKKLYDFDITVTGGDDFYASFDQKRKATTEMEVRWKDGSRSHITLYQVPVFDASGEIDVNYYIYLDHTRDRELALYRGNYIRVHSENLAKLSRGDLAFDLAIADANEYTESARRDFLAINQSLSAVRDTFATVIQDTGTLTRAVVDGDLSRRADDRKHQGDFQRIVEGMNQTLDAVQVPVEEALRVSREYASTNFRARMDPGLKMQGDWKDFKDALDSIGTGVTAAIQLVNNEVANLSASTERAQTSVGEVSANASQIAQLSAELSGSSEKGSHGVQQVLKAMEDLSTTVSDVATKTESVSRLANDANRLSQRGADIAKKADSGMQGITRNAADVEAIVSDIKSQMIQIGKIVDVISDLANQTNLLALNAAIEAARAGDAGRGFAVVATEVKSLALESRASAGNIAEMINTLQNKTLEASAAASQAGKTVKEGSEALRETLGMFNEIVSSVESISRNTEEVAGSSEEQAASVEEITASVNELVHIINDTTRGASEASVAAEEATDSIEKIGTVIGNVNSVAEKLSREMSRFRV